MLISTIVAVFWAANNGIDAAGWTREDVPIDKSRSHDKAASSASSRIDSGKDSPNHTTSGRIKLPQTGQRGGPLPVMLNSFMEWSFAKHLFRQILPWSSNTILLPACWCSPSMFCVMRVKRGKSFSDLARAKWPGFGVAVLTKDRRH